MKTLIIVMLLFIVTSCDKGYPHKPVIIQKVFTDFWGDPLPNCLCRFAYRKHTSIHHEAIMFGDSCHKYNIGDTLISKYR